MIHINRLKGSRSCFQTQIGTRAAPPHELGATYSKANEKEIFPRSEPFSVKDFAQKQPKIYSGSRFSQAKRGVYICATITYTFRAVLFVLN